MKRTRGNKSSDEEEVEKSLPNESGHENNGSDGDPVEASVIIQMDHFMVDGCHDKSVTAADIPENIVDKTTQPPTAYKKQHFLGRGGFAKCYQIAVDTQGESLACKIINKASLVKSRHMELITKEIKIHRTLKHSHIVAFHSYFEDSNFVYMVLELCELGSLMNLSKKHGPIPEPETSFYLKQMCEGLVYLHDQRKIIHRDLKLANIFLSSEMRIKIGDFGLATSHSNRKSAFGGTLNYIAPERLTDRDYGYEVDIWSIGIVLFALLTGSMPFDNHNVKKLKNKIKLGIFRFPQTPKLSSESRNLVMQTLQVDPSKRPSAREILKHYFIQKGERLTITSTYKNSCSDS